MLEGVAFAIFTLLTVPDPAKYRGKRQQDLEPSSLDCTDADVREL
eukprot:SAG31_NODE_15996_length_728_cov_0.759936_1_plen_44_part_10